MEIGASFVAGAEPFELVQPGEGALYHPSHFAQSGAVGDAASGDHGFDTALPQQAAVLVEVVATVGVQASRLTARASVQAPDRRDRVQQGQQLCDVVPVAAGERDGDRGSVTVDDQMVLGAGAGAVDGRGADVIPPLSARMCEPSTAQSSRSSRSARRNSLSRTACRCGQTPASVQSRSRRQAVTPEQPTLCAGTSRQATPVRSTYMMPASAARSGTRNRPGWRRRRSGAGGNSGTTRSHRSSGTRSARTLDTLPPKITERKNRSSTHSETISKPRHPCKRRPTGQDRQHGLKSACLTNPRPRASCLVPRPRAATPPGNEPKYARWRWPRAAPYGHQQRPPTGQVNPYDTSLPHQRHPPPAPMPLGAFKIWRGCAPR